MPVWARALIQREATAWGIIGGKHENAPLKNLSYVI